MKHLRIPMTKRSYRAIPENVYVARVKSIEVDKKGRYGPQLRWIFEIVKGKYKGQTLLTWSPTEANPKNKLGKWLKKLVPGLKFKEGKFDILKMALRKLCRVSVVHTEKVADDGTPMSKIDAVYSYKKKDDEEEEEEDEEEGEEEEGDESEEDDEEEDEEDEEDEDQDEEFEEDEEEEEEKPRKKKKKKGKKVTKKKKKKKKKKKQRDEDEDEEDEEEDEDDLSW